MHLVSASNPVVAHDRPASLLWLDRLKAVAIAWIFLNHLSERLFGYPFIGNPTPDWPPLTERVHQLRPLTGEGLWAVPLNLLRYVGWSGDQGVQLFLIASGFGLTWGLLQRTGDTPLSLVPFYRARARRIYPMWIAAHAGLAVAAYLLGHTLSGGPRALGLSLIGVRFTPGLFYSITPAWWYIGLLLQLYLVYPLLWRMLHRFGPARFLLLGCVISFAARAAGGLVPAAYLDPWLRGAVFVTRLPEFVLGMSLAAWMSRDPGGVDHWLQRNRTILAAFGVYIVATAASLTLLGMAIAPFLLGAASLAIVYRVAAWVREPGGSRIGPWAWLGRHSYSLFLVHDPVIRAVIPDRSGAPVGSRLLADLLIAAAATLLAAWALEVAARSLPRSIAQFVRRRGVGRSALLCTAAMGILGVVLLGSEALVRRFDPQEVYGWGERAALEPSDAFGWRLKPSQRTRLRWERYDYVVEANALGFPEPSYPEAKPPGVLRILVTGDAFTSAEGVDTGEAWPRILEPALAARLAQEPSGGVITVQVLNFAMTGYGPDQETRVIETFAPKFAPDLILIEMFVNDFEDVERGDEWFRRSIGFTNPSPEGWRAWLTLVSLRQWSSLRLNRVRDEWLLRRPWQHGYFLGNFTALERSDREGTQRRTSLVENRLARIQRAVEAIGARVILAFVPAPVQVCGPDQLDYYPRHVDLSDGVWFDRERPQRLGREIADRLGLRFYDLREAFAGTSPTCPYQRANMHWTAEGHRAAAEFLATRLVADGYVASFRNDAGSPPHD